MSRLFVIGIDPVLQGRLSEAFGALCDDVPAATLASFEAATAATDIVVIDAAAAQQHCVHLTNRASGARWFVAHQADPAATVAAADIAQRIGAHDVIAADSSQATLRLRLVAPSRLAAPSRERGVVRPELRQPRKSDVIIGGGVWHKELFDRINMVASTDVAIAIFGESGTGKELVARTIHRSSPRRDAPFVVVNCAAIPAALLEDELFGHVRGAFTDATRDREGLIAAAAGGTLFLDEIGELPLPLQAKLLRFLQSHEIRRIGDDVDRFVDVRVVTATNRDLERAIADGSFREDLYYRIAVFAMRLPPLRERRADIPLLVHHLVTRLAGRLGRKFQGASPAALDALAHYPFAGNIRELENKLHHAMVVSPGEWIEPEDLGLPIQAAVAGQLDLQQPFRELKAVAVAQFEKHYIIELMTATGGNVAQAARQAGIDRKNIWALLKRYGITRASFVKD